MTEERPLGLVEDRREAEEEALEETANDILQLIELSGSCGEGRPLKLDATLREGSHTFLKYQCPQESLSCVLHSLPSESTVQPTGPS